MARSLVRHIILFFCFILCLVRDSFIFSLHSHPQCSMAYHRALKINTCLKTRIFSHWFMKSESSFVDKTEISASTRTVKYPHLPLHIAPKSWQTNKANFYLNISKDDREIRLIKASLEESRVFEVSKNETDFESFVENKEAFTNISELVKFDKIRAVSARLGRKLKEYRRDSIEWDYMINATEAMNRTTFPLAFAGYDRVPDNYSNEIYGVPTEFQPAKGYMGTLPPGSTFEEPVPLNQTPHYLLHPWPAFQEFQMSVRLPVSHGFVIPPLIWLAKMNMFHEDNEGSMIPHDHNNKLVGGYYMEYRDAVILANISLGEFYDEKEQERHGGNQYLGRKNIPFYEPDLPPTIPEDEIDRSAPIPEFQFMIDKYTSNGYINTEKPKQPFDDKMASDLELDSEDEDHYAKEEETRKQAAEKIIQHLKSLNPKTEPPNPRELEWSKEHERLYNENLLTLRRRRSIYEGVHLLQADIDNYETMRLPGYDYGNTTEANTEIIDKAELKFDQEMARRLTRNDISVMASVQGWLRNFTELLKFAEDTGEILTNQTIISFREENLFEKDDLKLVQLPRVGSINKNAKPE